VRLRSAMTREGERRSLLVLQVIEYRSLDRSQVFDPAVDT
jgi:hypothetical protein